MRIHANPCKTKANNHSLHSAGWNVVAGFSLVRDLGHEEIFGERGQVLGSQLGVLISQSRGQVRIEIIVRSSPDCVDDLVNGTWDVLNSLGDGHDVVLNIALVVHVGEASEEGDVFITLVEDVADFGTGALSLLEQTLEVEGVVDKVSLELVIKLLEGIPTLHAVRLRVGGVALEILEVSLPESRGAKHIGVIEDFQDGRDVLGSGLIGNHGAEHERVSKSHLLFFPDLI